MPIQVIETTDPITNLIRFETSPVFEMLFSLHLFYHPGLRADWADEARAAVSQDFLRALDSVYKPYDGGFLFFELAIDYPDQGDVPGFIKYVREMDPARFVFYLVGRIVPIDVIEQTAFDHAALVKAIEATPYDVMCQCLETPWQDILADVPAFQARLTDLWARYWDEFFRDEVETLRPHWEGALNDKSAFLSREGGMALYQHVTGKDKLVPPLPADYPVEEVVFIPVYLIPTNVYVFYGYGNITIVFDSERTQERIAAIEQGKERALAALKALGDNSRLDIVRQIAHHEGAINGKRIAAKLNLSASAVSRHLGQLKDAGVIVEEAQDNRAIAYRVQWDTIKDLPDLLVDYLLH